MNLSLLKQDPSKLEAKKKRFEYALYFVGAGLLIAAQPLLYSLMQSVFAITATGVMIVVAQFGGPVLVKKLSRWKYESLIAEAKKNPIWVLHNRQETMERELLLARENIAQQQAHVNAFKERARAIQEKSNDPAKRQSWQERMDLYDERMRHRISKYRKAIHDKQLFDEKVSIAVLEWEAVLADKAASVAFSNMQGDPMDRIMCDTAFAHVSNSAEASFAELRLEVIEQNWDAEPALIQNKNTQVIEVS